MEEKVTTIIKNVLERMGAAFSGISFEQNELGAVFAIETENGESLIGNRGETLLALNYLVKKIAEKEGVVEPFSLDVNRYQKARLEEMVAKARLLAERAKMFRVDVEMDPMSSYERMVAHATLAGDPNIKTESVGFGRERRLVIKYIKSENVEDEKSI